MISQEWPQFHSSIHFMANTLWLHDLILDSKGSEGRRVRHNSIELGQSIHDLYGSYPFYVRSDTSSIRTTSCIATASWHKTVYCFHIPGTELSAVKEQHKNWVICVATVAEGLQSAINADCKQLTFSFPPSAISWFKSYPCTGLNGP